MLRAMGGPLFIPPSLSEVPEWMSLYKAWAALPSRFTLPTPLTHVESSKGPWAKYGAKHMIRSCCITEDKPLK